jgi:hypothetical protein
VAQKRLEDVCEQVAVTMSGLWAGWLGAVRVSGLWAGWLGAVTMSGLWAGWLGVEWAVGRLFQGLISDRWKRFCIFFKSIQTGCVPTQSSTLSVSGILFMGLKHYWSWPLTSNLVLSLRMNGAIPCSLYLPSWHAQGQLCPFVTDTSRGIR